MEDGESSMVAGQVERKFANTSAELASASASVAPAGLGVAMNNITPPSSSGNVDSRVIVPSGATATSEGQLVKRRKLEANDSGASNGDLDFGVSSFGTSSGAQLYLWTLLND